MVHLRFASSSATRRTFPRTWRPARALPRRRKAGVLSGIKIALDPATSVARGAKMEERWFKSGDSRPSRKGDDVDGGENGRGEIARLGARVSFVREKTEPVTPFRPDDFREAARAMLKASGTENPPKNSRGRTIR